MPRSEQRQAALNLCLVTLGLAACAFVWVALLTFSPADPPAGSAWPPNAAPANWCGRSGALVAYYLFFYLGLGAYVFVGLASLRVLALARGVRIADPLLRAVGAGLMIASVSSAAEILAPASPRFLAVGPGGVLGVVAAAFLLGKLQMLFTLLLLACSFLVGLLLAADELFFGVSRGIGVVGRHSAPALARGGAALANAGAAVAAGVVSVSGRLASMAATRAAPAPSGASSARRGPVVGPGGVLMRPSARPRAIARDEPAEREFDQVEHEPPPQSRNAPPPTSDEADEDGSDEAEAPVEAPALPPRSGSNGAAARTGTNGPVVRELGRSTPLPRSEPPRVQPGPGRDGYLLPPLTLLGDPEPIDKEKIELLCREKAYILEQTLNEFRLEVQVVAIETGPVITVFELKLAPGIKVSQIASLTNDMARALRAPAVRVVAPLPGKNTIGIEVPNLDKEKVRLKDLLAATAAHIDPHGIPLYLGKDASGQPLVSDLTRMPHLLIAGTTGSGKSVCVSSIIMSILLTRTPAEVSLILVDPKVVELAMFKDIPHLMCPIVTEMAKAEAILDWTATKMDERYALLAEAGVKDIRSYNRLGEKGLRERLQIADDEELGSVPVHLPFMVIVIDELADLMMTSAKEVEFYLCRIAQKSRAVGIHLIVSTQRPQANVVTGLIKSNLPCRIAFRVASRLDSRIVLDQNGGEVLMGQGDMLFLPPGSSKLVRAQGTYISDEELRESVKHSRGQGQPSYHPELIRIPKAGGEGAGERDELFDEAVDIILETQRGSVSLLQRRLTVGYSRASRLIDQMYEAGLVGEYKGSQAREIIVSREEWEQIKAQRNREEAQESAEA